jgi:hypothetical protein
VSGNKIYPEKPSATASAQKEVNVVASIDRLPSAGMKGTVHLKQLDPMNQCTASLGTPNTVGTVPNDNNGTLNNINGKTLEFTQGSGINTWVKGTFGNAHPGDNYIVAAHQHNGTAAAITITSSSPYTNPTVAGKTPTASGILEVWRTLWAELDQMVLAGGTTAGFPDIGGTVASELENAHITIKEYSSNPRTTVSGSDPINSNNSSYFSSRDLNSSYNVSDFWTAYLVGVFRSADGPTGIAYCGMNNIYIFHWAISDSVDAWNAANPSDTVTLQAIKERTTLHEITHLLSLDHETAHGIMYSVLSGSNLYAPSSLSERLRNGNNQLSVSNIKKIQSISKPE